MTLLFSGVVSLEDELYSFEGVSLVGLGLMRE